MRIHCFRVLVCGVLVGLQAQGCNCDKAAKAPPGTDAVVLLLLIGRRRLRLLLLSAAGLAGMACTEAPAQDARACVADVWFQPERVALACPAGACAECDATDCQRRGFQWLREDGGAVTGFVFVSRSTGTFSSAGPPREAGWSLSSDTLTIDEEAGTVSCTVDALLWDGRNFERAPTTAEQQLENAWGARDDDGSWRSQPFGLE